MTRRLRLLPALLAAAILLAACGGGGSKTPAFGIVDWPAGTAGKVGPEVGQRAPNFRLETPGGGQVDLASTVGAGKPVLLNFWATWCANCREEMATLQTASQGQASVVGVNLREGDDAVSKLAGEVGATFPLALDRKGTVTREYRVTNLPVTLLIDTDGTIREVVRGPIDDAKVSELLASLGAGGGA